MSVNFNKSKQGRKVRKDSFEANHDMEKVEAILRDLYLNRQMSTTQIPKIMSKEYKIEISASKCYNLIKKMEVLRGKSESVSIAISTLDYREKIITPELKSIIDGMAIGDGCIGINKSSTNLAGRLSIGSCHRELASYYNKLLSPYCASEIKFAKGSKGSGMWNTTTKFHPDLYDMYKRWYGSNAIKDIPSDIKIDRMLVLLWYLGDGSISAKRDGSRSLYFATNSFSRKSIENILVPKLEEQEIFVSSISKDNRLFIKTKSIPKIIEYMGGESPVKCMSYKFDVDSWRFKKGMRDAAKDLDIDYHKLANWVKRGIISHSRSPGGKKVLFSDKEFDELKERVDSGELPRKKGGKARCLGYTPKDKEIETSKFIKFANESEDEFYNRVAESYYKHGFPYRIWDNNKLNKEWHSLKKSQYIIPNKDVVKWRRGGFGLADHFHPHIFKMNNIYKISPIELFNDKDLFRSALKKHVEHGGTLTYAGVINAICRNSKSKRVNNFPVLVARDIYNYYCKNGDVVLDPCSGFSSRMIGASLSKHDLEYMGTDPNIDTYNGLIKTKSFINEIDDSFKCNIFNGMAEIELKKYKDSLFDFCFTSPPYFNTEIYAKDKSQSCIKYPNYKEWVENFLKNMMVEIYRVMKPESYVVINIGKSGRHDIPSDLIKISKEIGFELDQLKHISFPQYRFVSEKSRLEPLIILKK